jgi:hypothetical protein
VVDGDSSKLLIFISKKTPTNGGDFTEELEKNLLRSKDAAREQWWA